MIDLKFCDLWGRWHHLTIPAKQFNPDLMDKGIGFDGSAVGLKSVKAGDMVLVPDLNTAFMDPFWDTPILSFLCTTLAILPYALRTSSSQRLLQTKVVGDLSTNSTFLIALRMNMG
jgi:glutamine synthetase